MKRDIKNFELRVLGVERGSVLSRRRIHNIGKQFGPCGDLGFIVIRVDDEKFQV